LSLGVETRGGLFTKLIDRNATIPTKVSQVFSTTTDNQERVDIHILQGERRLSSENRSLGHITLPGIPTAPRGFPQIEVTFAIDSNSIHTVSAEDLDTGRSQSVQIEPASGLDEDEIERLVREAAEYAREDEERHEMQRLRIRLQGLIESCEKVCLKFAPVLDQESKDQVRETLLKARGALRSTHHRNRLETAMFDLDTASGMLTEFMLDPTE
jgi:molecular chaperone DnaK